ncbi:MAG: DUF2946 family protein [Burkholderiales bacterium]
MDESVLRGMARWPGVPAVYGWLALDRRGNWLLKDPGLGRLARVGNAALREFIGRNYASDALGRWFFQNGPQRVYVSLAYTPLVLRLEGGSLVDHCGRPARARSTHRDEEGSVLILVERGVGLLDDRDLMRFVEESGQAPESWPEVRRNEVAARFGFVADPPEKAAGSLR